MPIQLHQFHQGSSKNYAGNDERYSGTTPIWRATGAPSNFSGLLAYVLATTAGAPGGCKVQLENLGVDRT